MGESGYFIFSMRQEMFGGDIVLDNLYNDRICITDRMKVSYAISLDSGRLKFDTLTYINKRQGLAMVSIYHQIGHRHVYSSPYIFDINSGERITDPDNSSPSDRSFGIETKTSGQFILGAKGNFYAPNEDLLQTVSYRNNLGFTYQDRKTPYLTKQIIHSGMLGNYLALFAYPYQKTDNNIISLNLYDTSGKFDEQHTIRGRNVHHELYSTKFLVQTPQYSYTEFTIDASGKLALTDSFTVRGYVMHMYAERNDTQYMIMKSYSSDSIRFRYVIRGPGKYYSERDLNPSTCFVMQPANLRFDKHSDAALMYYSRKDFQTVDHGESHLRLYKSGLKYTSSEAEYVRNGVNFIAHLPSEAYPWTIKKKKPVYKVYYDREYGLPAFRFWDYPSIPEEGLLRVIPCLITGVSKKDIWLQISYKSKPATKDYQYSYNIWCGEFSFMYNNLTGKLWIDSMDQEIQLPGANTFKNAIDYIVGYYLKHSFYLK